jgi:hypothetical protein
MKDVVGEHGPSYICTRESLNSGICLDHICTNQLPKTLFVLSFRELSKSLMEKFRSSLLQSIVSQSCTVNGTAPGSV